MNNNDYTVVPLKKAVVNKYINFAKYSENIKSIKNISRNEKSICRTTLQNIRWEGTGKHFFHIIK